MFRRTAGFVALALLPLPALSEGGAPGMTWPGFRGDPALTGVAGGELSVSPAPAWRFDTEEGFESTAAIVDGRVFVGGLDGVLYALSLADGEEIWRYEAEAEIKSSPLVAGERVFFVIQVSRVDNVGTEKRAWFSSCKVFDRKCRR